MRSLLLLLLLRTFVVFAQQQQRLLPTSAATDCFISVGLVPNEVVSSVVVCVDAEHGQLDVTMHTKLVLQTPVWRVRVVGPRIQLLQVRRVANETLVWRARASLCGGVHFLEPMLIHREFDADNLMANCVETTALRLLREPFQFSVLLDCRYEAGWLVRNETSLATLRQLATTRVENDDTTWTALTAAMWNAALEYVPSKHTGSAAVLLHQQQQHLLLPTAATSRGGSGVYFFGDSQMRFMFNHLLRQRAVPCSAEFDANKGVCVDPLNLYSYFPIYWPSDFIDEAWVAGRALIVLNVGQWSASWVGGYPDAIADYRARLYDLLARVVSYNITTWFLSTNPGPLAANKLGCPAQDWRTDALIERYNVVALEIVRQLQAASTPASAPLEFIDTNDITLPVEDLAEDGSHYNGVVGAATAARIHKHLQKFFQQ